MSLWRRCFFLNTSSIGRVFCFLREFSCLTSKVLDAGNAGPITRCAPPCANAWAPSRSAMTSRLEETITRKKIASRPPTRWRYREFSSLDRDPVTSPRRGLRRWFRAALGGCSVAAALDQEDSAFAPAFVQRPGSPWPSHADESAYDLCLLHWNLANAGAAHAAAAT